MNQRHLAALAVGTTWSYPALLVSSFYATWLIAWASLGRAPQPWVDDPGSISAAVTGAQVVATLLLVGFPVAAFSGLAATLWLSAIHQLSWSRTLSLIVALLLIWLAAIAFLRWDPLRVGDWFMD